MKRTLHARLARHLALPIALALATAAFAAHAEAPDIGRLAWLAGCWTAEGGEPGSGEHPQHEFPQRVVYAREGADRLAARIEGMRGGSLRVIPFPMVRVSCDALLQGAKP
ncbi:MAG TPA: hypothetical protein VHA82_16290 [Ramlibacter sp.]|uniref:hypothetical protein n=1 Tax=Ramlibacter sp. TaxID=1917967 RepID=UPI002B55A12A|nr:hypothetical protein [Ramlibacter sp.]HVZ45372.1 hypothetical protein [Ramlibacter sp.]